MGTRVKEVRTLFDKDVTMRCIYEPLRACPADADALEMAVLLEERGFDVAGVKEPDSDSITRFVNAASLKMGGYVRDRAVNIAIENLVADATSLAEVFSILGRREYSFVLVDADVFADLRSRPEGRPEQTPGKDLPFRVGFPSGNASRVLDSERIR